MKTAQETTLPLHIRRGMDVYSAYQNQYIGTVVTIWEAASTAASAKQRGATPQQATSHQMPGEDMGPFPTQTLGNTGPQNQAAGHHYATQPRQDDRPGVVCFAVLPIQPGWFNPFARKLYIPTSAVLSISMERIILNIQQDHIPQDWLRKPG
jgi:hypothetical protein